MTAILDISRELLQDLNLPVTKGFSVIKEFCIKSASVIFCTVSGSSKLEGQKMDLLLIDEAAQLKECKSLIPLQVSGLKHAVLIGDERPTASYGPKQDKALLGRSLFERLGLLGHKKHLLNVQYRMHPSISIFLNFSFYDMQILNGPNVMQTKHRRSTFQVQCSGHAYSFINIDGVEDRAGAKRTCPRWSPSCKYCTVSRKVCEFPLNNNSLNISFYVTDESCMHLGMPNSCHGVCRAACVSTGKVVSVGVICPYTAQVEAIQGWIGDVKAMRPLFLRVNSVDGFQGNEEM
ncbi:putative ATP-dependent helicase [Hordeum vulgare]|nr:putative ATP-dependent helicase [Hordeum vulgare]